MSSPESAAPLGRRPIQSLAIIVQARMTSTRLPGKVLAPVLGRPMLAYQLERLARVRTPHITVVATTTNASDDPIARLAREAGSHVFRGSEDDVLARYAGAAADVAARTVVRVTSDCPLIDPAVIDRVIDRYAGGDCDYASNTLVRTYPRGLDTEVLSVDTLAIAAREAIDPVEREHVTPFVYRRPERFRLCSVESEVDLSRHRWTVDEAGDLAFVREVYEALYSSMPDFGVDAVIELGRRRPDILGLNAGVRQKALS